MLVVLDDVKITYSVVYYIPVEGQSSKSVIFIIIDVNN